MDNTEVIEMFKAGMSSGDIAIEMDVPAKDVRAVLEEAGLLEHPGRKSMAASIDAPTRKELITDYLNNKVPAIQLIQRYGLTWNAFYKILDEEGIQFREVRQVDKLARAQRLERAVEMYLGGARLWEIENETGIRQPVLHSELHKRGVPLRRAVEPPTA